MKAYIDELPENCWKCIFSDNQKGYCDLLETRILRQFTRRAFGCPLKSLTDYTKQVRKEVVQEIIQELSKIEDTLINLGNGKEDAFNYFIKILDQIQGDN